ncbi:MAG: cellulase family glycosylhydrolase [Armatimonadota bacterium]
MKILILSILVCSVLTGITVARADSFLKADGAKLTLDGKPYRAIGMNAPDLFSRYAGLGLNINEANKAENRKASIDSILDAETNKIAFFRFWASAFWPVEMQLYFDNPDQYWKSMDEVFALCRQHHIKLIPSIFFHHNLWPMICEENASAIIDPNSKTFKAMHNYAKELVTRYKDDPNVLMWEITNEGFLGADVQMEGRDAPGAGVYLPNAKLTKTKWVKEDSLTTDMLLKFYTEMTRYIKSIDPNHMVTSGDAGVRDCSQSLKESYPDQVWTKDTLRQHVSNLLASQPEPLDVTSQHHYGSNTGRIDTQVADMPVLEYYRTLIRAAHSVKVPLLIGECGQMNPTMKDDPSAKFTREFLHMTDKEGVALTCVWAWHFPSQPENTITSKTHPLLVKQISSLNTKYAGLK